MISFTVKTPSLELCKIESKLHSVKVELLLNRMRMREKGAEPAEWKKLQKQISSVNVKLTVLKAMRQYQHNGGSYAC